MNSSKRDYAKFYQLQDKFLLWCLTLGFPFYLTGETTLGRFYLHHRFSDTPVNILSNKLTAIVSRDEPKDIFDIIHLSLNYSFN
jgi:hypothetical protein